ncbi:ETEC_3214 domain-containing protein, partial [Shewanella sp.]
MKGLMEFILQVVTGNHLQKDDAETESSGWFSGVIRFIVFCAFLLMGLGNWSDSKQLLTEAYQGFITNFTHKVEDKTIANIHIGNYLKYVEKSVGMPQVIKVSERQNDLEYRYYKKNKYLLILIAQEQRIAAMMLHTLPTEEGAFVDRFNPSIPFTDHKLVSSSIDEAIGSSNEFFFDN